MRQFGDTIVTLSQKHLPCGKEKKQRLVQEILSTIHCKSNNIEATPTCYKTEPFNFKIIGSFLLMLSPTARVRHLPYTCCKAFVLQHSAYWERKALSFHSSRTQTLLWESCKSFQATLHTLHACLHTLAPRESNYHFLSHSCGDPTGSYK